MAFFLISSMVLGLLDQLQIFSQLYLIELLGLLTGVGLLELWHLIYPRLLTGFGMLIFFKNLSLIMEFQVRYLALFLLFSVIFFFSIWVFFHEHSRFTGQQGKGEGIYLTPLCHFHPLHRHLDISRAITAESSPLHIAGSRTRTGNLWFPSASR